MPTLSPFDPAPGADQLHLRLLETTDLHMHLWPYDYFADRPSDRVGLSRTATLIRQARAEVPNSLFFDNGDFLQGTPMGDLSAKTPGAPHPMLRVMRHLGYDAIALGNHEFNYGLEVLQTLLSQADFPVVASNVAWQDGSPLASPYALLDRTFYDGAGQMQDLRIGVIGLLPPQILTWDRRHLEGHLICQDIVDTARRLVPEMREKGAEVLVALCHAGIGGLEPVQGMEHAATALGGIPGIDAVLAGHSHLVFPGPDHKRMPGVDPEAGTLQGTPAVMAGVFGSHLGVIDLFLERRADRWRVTSHRSEARPIFGLDATGSPVAKVADDPSVLALSRDAHEATLSVIRQPVGSTPVPLHSYFSQLPGSAALAAVAEAQAWHVAQALKGTDLADLPLLSAVAPFKAGGRAGSGFYTDVPAGPVALRNLADLYLYPNDLQAILICGSDLQDWLERAAGQFAQIPPGSRDAPLLDPRFSAYNFDVIHGLSYEVDLSQPARCHPQSGAVVAPSARRIRDLRYMGAAVRPSDQFVLATNGYRAGGGGSFPGTGGSHGVLGSSETVLEVLVSYFKTHPKLPAPRVADWRFAPMAGTSVSFDTGSGALDYDADITRLGLTDLGPSKDGFRRFRLPLNR